METTRQHLVETLEKFLEYAGYQRRVPEPVGFVRPDIDAVKALGQQQYRLVATTRPRIEEALDGFRDLVALKYYLGENATMLWSSPRLANSP